MEPRTGLGAGMFLFIYFSFSFLLYLFIYYYYHYFFSGATTFVILVESEVLGYFFRGKIFNVAIVKFIFLKPGNWVVVGGFIFMICC